MPEKLNEQDKRLLDALQANCRLSNQELAERAGMSASACWRRVKALEEAGLITQYAALLDVEKAGLGFQAIVHVSLTRHDHRHVDTFIAETRRRPEVLDCYSTTGEADYHLRVVCRDLAAYNRFLEDFLFRLPGIANVRTNLVLKDIKKNSPVPVQVKSG
ncbi:Lrp/AsnC family transcriptional regulator [Nitratireductor rhodophyticola]|uniref:Lrp/AsnC family transcriptional regulator n=1 Tax=Nitratireductor rhodophyticola TaxID=2854036 RepID=A0ABS7R7K6_9HYPH|nr:Lrp/AsnC family transcriptional regulator [Nitratireductor rhodophyticola]MBY8916917.1 Lrp/AsnC family transcriptional regulator [Nitratireductor rhodophyticola]MBY8920654.1 Lrp/AsnC family transcriptional regulator [Nitratireductor rhodophyticola]WPZ14666.1 Lrp/AsnC family transcriptional regulator [Nitratireductor rhodophyticola]